MKLLFFKLSKDSFKLIKFFYLFILFTINQICISQICTPSTCCSGQGITNVTLNTINNSSSANNYVSDFTATSTNLISGSPYTLQISAKSYSAYSSAYVRAWIDWDNDGVFNTTDASIVGGEQYTIGTISNTSGAPLAPMVINVPPTSPKALPLRLRVSAAYNSYTTSCATGADAEFEDYTIYVSGLNVTDITPFSGCSGVASSPQTLVISAKGLDPASTVNITTLPTGYEISSDALLPSYFTDPNIFRFTPDVNGNITGENLYLRLSSSASNGDNGDLSFSATLSNSTPADPVVKNTGNATVISSPTQPGTISGSNQICSSINNDFSISSVASATSYTWSYSGSGSVTGSSTTGTLNASSAGNISVVASNSCGSSSARTLAISINPSAFYVDPTGTDASGYGLSTGSNAFATLGYAISQICSGVTTTVNVAAGTYSDDLIDITSSHNGLSIVGAGMGSTIFQQSGSGDHFMEIKSSATNISISNLTIQNYDEDNNGGGIDITSGTVTIENVHFHNNSTTSSSDDGGAVYAGSGTNVTISKCKFTENESYNNQYSSGSCIYSEATLTLTNTLFYDNVCNYSSSNGHVYVGENSATIYNCTFTENGSGDPLVFYGNSATGYVRNCLFYNNSSTYDVREIYVTATDPEMDNCYYEARTGDFNTGSESGNLTSGSVNFTDASSNDFTLGGGSVCIDAGTSSGAPSTDFNGISRPQGLGYDMGCFELVFPTWTGSSSTVWSTASNWSTGSVPGSTDPVIIADVTNNPVLDATDQVGSITIQSGGVLTINSSITLTASSVEIQSGGDLVISSGELNCTGKFDHDGDLTMSGSGVLDIDGEYESSGSATEIISGGTIEVAGEWDGALDDAFTPTGGTVTMNGSSDKNLAQHASSNFYNLIIANSGGDVDVTAALDIDGDLTINASGDLDIGGGNANVELAGSFSNSGTFTTSGESFTFNGSGDKTSSAISDATLDVVINKTSSGSVTFSGTCSFDEFTVTAGKAAMTSNTITADNTISIADGAELEIGTGTFNADGAINANTTGEIDFTGAGNLICSSSITSLGDLDHEAGTVEIDGASTSIPAETFYNLSIKTAGTKTASGNITVNNDLTTAATTNCKLDMGANSLTLKGNLNVGATDGLDLTDVSCVFTMSGSSAQNITHAGATGSGTEVSETGESGLGGFSTTGDVSFTTTSSYYKNGSNCIFNDYTNSDDNYLTSTANIDLSSYTGAELSFWQIAKTEGTYDKCRIQYSDDGGSSWTTFPNSKYEGSAIDYSSRVYFHEDSYSTWGYTTETPDNSTWWKQETFDMDFLAGQNDIRIRFWLYSDGSAVRSGWYIDDIVVTGTNSSGPEFKNLTINNSAGLVMASDMEIEGTLNLASGSINTNGNSLHITASGSVTGSKGTSPCDCIYPDAYSQELTTTSEVEFRTGNNDGSQRKSVYVKPSSATSVTFQADFVPTVHADASDCPTAGLDHISSASYYNINRTAGTESAIISLEWYTNDQVDDVSSILLAHYDGTSWGEIATTVQGPGGSGSPSGTGGRVTSSSALSSFSPFALGSSNSGNALPIDLLSFTGACENNETELEFVVASQINNDFFSIYRSSNATEWNLVGEIEGVGNTSTQMTYKWIDNNPISGTNYYRLSQTDYDGTSESFAPIVVTCEMAPIDGYSVYPNPADGLLNIDLELEHNQGEDVSIEVRDISGKVIQLQQVQLTRGYNHLEVDLSEIPSGVYMINFSGTKDYIKESRIVKQ